jgi:hypothetical protein
MNSSGFTETRASELFIEFVRVQRHQNPPAEALEFRMREHALSQPLAEASAPVIRQYENIAKITDGREIHDDPSRLL